jgi:Protein of unknown function (DUF3551)
MRTLIASSSLAAVVAALLVASPPALAQSAPFCLRSTSGMANCVFQTMAQCEAAKGINVAAQCIPISEARLGSGTSPTTTGQGAPRPGASPSR